MTITDTIRREPIRVRETLGLLVTTITTGLVVFGAWSPTEEQTAWLYGLPAVVFAIIGLGLRHRVTPNSNVAATKSEVDAYSARIGRPVALHLMPYDANEDDPEPKVPE